MITPDQFFGKWDGKGVDWDGYYGFQCMDLYRQFVAECLGFPQSPPVTGAKDVWNTYLVEKFDRILNTIEAIPIKGDVVIWSSGVGAYGHIAICKDGTQTTFTSFDQNWPVGSLCHFQPHNYTNVLGWLRVKQPTETTTSSTTTTTNTTSTTKTTVSTVTQPPITPPDSSGEVIALKEKLEAVKVILYGKGWTWTKIAKIKELLPK